MKNSVKKIMEEEVNKGALPGYAVGIYHKGNEEYVCKGKASIESNLEIQPNTKFHMASITKHITALLFRKVECEGLVSENDFISSFFPNSQLHNKNIQIKHLLNHKSGIRDQWELAELSGWTAHDIITNDNIIEIFNNQKDLNFFPNTHYSYSNTGYTLLALILEKVTGKNIKYLLEKYVIRPNNLFSTGYYSYNDVIENFAIPYKAKKNNSKEYLISKPNFSVTGSTSMYSSAEDLLFLEKKYHEKYKSLPFDVEKNTLNSIDRNSGFYHDGFINYFLSGSLIQMHSGWDYGYSAFLLRILNYDTSIVLFSNYGVPNLFPYAIKIAVLLKPDLMKDPLIKIAVANKDLNPIANRDVKYCHYLNYKSNVIITITNHNGTLIFEKSCLSKIQDNLFLVEDSLNKVNFINSKQFHLMILDSNMEFELIENDDVDPVLEIYQGRFYSTELETTYKVEKDNGELILLGPKSTKHRLITINKHFFKTENFTLKFIFLNEKVTGFSISNLRAWNLFFEKIIINKAD